MVIDTIETDEGGQEIFSQRQNLAFKIRRAWTLDVEFGPEALDRRRQAACSKGRRPTGPPMRGTRAIAAGASRYTTTTARASYSEEESYEGGGLRGAHPFAAHHSILQQPASGARALNPATSRGPFLRGVLGAGRSLIDDFLLRLKPGRRSLSALRGP